MSIIMAELEYLQVIIIALIIIIPVTLRRKSRIQLNEPPLVPYKYPIIGHTFVYYKDVPGFLKKCREEYGEIFSLYIWGSVQTYVGKELYSEVFKNNQIFDFHKAIDDMVPMHDFLNRPAGFFSCTGQFVKEFLQDLTLFGERSQQSAIKSIDDLIGDGKIIQSPLKMVTHMVARTFAPVIIGEELCEDKEMLDIFANVRTDLISLLSIPPVLNFIYPNLHRKFLIIKFRYFDNSVKNDQRVIISKITPVIKQRINDRNKLGISWKRPNDMLQALMEKFAIDENNVDVGCVADVIISILVAAINTTSTTLLQCLCEYVNYPEYHKELLEEAEKIYNRNKNMSYLTTNEIFKMEKLDHFVKETLRINRNFVALNRKNIAPQFTFANGYQVPKDRFILTIQHHIHIDSKIFGQNPEKFNPNHHINSPATRPERHFLAFTIGKFTCPGRFFAVNEMKRILHFIILKYNIKGESGKHIEPKRAGGYLSPSDENLIFEKRKGGLQEYF